MFTRKTAKSILRLSVAIGTGTILNSTVRNQVGPPKNKIDEITVKSATFAVGAAVSKRTSSYADEAVDQVADAINEIKSAFNQK
jgi:predicted porin